MSIRLESDSVGSLPVPSDAYYGIQSLRAKENFPISGRAMHPAFLHSLTQIKLAAAHRRRHLRRLRRGPVRRFRRSIPGGRVGRHGHSTLPLYRVQKGRSAGQGIAVRWRTHPRPRPARRPIRARDTFPPPEPCHTVRGKSINAPFRTPAR